MQSSPRWMVKDTSALRSELWGGVETGSQCYFTWFVVFFCCSDKVGLRLVSLQQAHALSMTLRERGRGEGVKERIRQPHQRHQVEMDSNSLGPNQMYGEGCEWIMNLGGFGANCADRKGISMNNSLCRGPYHLPPTSITLFLRHPSSLLLAIDPYNLLQPFPCNAYQSICPSEYSLCLCLKKSIFLPSRRPSLFSLMFQQTDAPWGKSKG